MTYLPNLVLFTSAVTLSNVVTADRYSIEVSAQQKTLTTIEAREQLLSSPRSIEMIQSIPAPGDDWRFQSELRELIRRAQNGETDLATLREQIQDRQDSEQLTSSESSGQEASAGNVTNDSGSSASNVDDVVVDSESPDSVANSEDSIVQSKPSDTSSASETPLNSSETTPLSEASESVIRDTATTPNSMEKTGGELLADEDVSDQLPSNFPSEPVMADSAGNADASTDTGSIVIPEPKEYAVSILPVKNADDDDASTINENVDVSMGANQDAEPLATKNALETLSNAKEQTRKPAMGPEGYGIEYTPSAKADADKPETRDLDAVVTQESEPENMPDSSVATEKSATTQSLVDALPPHVLKSFKGLDSMTDEEFLEFLINLEYLEQARKGDQVPEIAPILSPIPVPAPEVKSKSITASDDKPSAHAETKMTESQVDENVEAPLAAENDEFDSNSEVSENAPEEMSKPVISIQRERISSQRYLSANETEMTTTTVTTETTTTTTTSVKSRSVTYMEMVDVFGELITVQEADGTVWQKIYVEENDNEGNNVWRDLWVQVKETGELIFENTKEGLSSGAMRIRNFFNSEKTVGETISVEEAEIDCGLCIPYTPDPLRSQLTEELKDVIRFTPADVRSLSGQPKLTRLHGDDCGLCIPYEPDPLRSMLSAEMVDIIRWAPPAYLLKFTVTPYGIEPEMDPKRPPSVPDMKPVDPRSKFKRGAGDYEGRFREESNGPNQHFYVPIFDN